MFQKLSPEDFIKTVSERESKIRNILDFGVYASRKIGYLENSRTENSYTVMDYRIKNLEGLDFDYDSGHSMMGMDSMHVHYKGSQVLSVNFYEGKNQHFEVIGYSPGEWEKIMDNLIANRDSVIEKFAREKQSQDMLDKIERDKKIHETVELDKARNKAKMLGPYMNFNSE